MRTNRQQELNRLAQQRYRCAARPPPPEAGWPRRDRRAPPSQGSTRDRAFAVAPAHARPIAPRVSARRERKKQKAATLVTAVDELSKQLDELATLRESHSQLHARHTALETAVARQQQELVAAQATVAAQQQTIQQQAATIKEQAERIQRGEAEAAALLRDGAAADPSGQVVNEQLAAAMRAVLSGVPPRETQEVQAVLAALPPSLLKRLHNCCREVSAHLHNADLKEQPHAIQVSCC